MQSNRTRFVNTRLAKLCKHSILQDIFSGSALPLYNGAFEVEGRPAWADIELFLALRDQTAECEILFSQAELALIDSLIEYGLNQAPLDKSEGVA